MDETNKHGSKSDTTGDAVTELTPQDREATRRIVAETTPGIREDPISTVPDDLSAPQYRTLVNVVGGKWAGCGLAAFGRARQEAALQQVSQTFEAVEKGC